MGVGVLGCGGVCWWLCLSCVALLVVVLVLLVAVAVCCGGLLVTVFVCVGAKQAVQMC